MSIDTTSPNILCIKLIWSGVVVGNRRGGGKPSSGGIYLGVKRHTYIHSCIS